MTMSGNAKEREKWKVGSSICGWKQLDDDIRHILQLLPSRLVSLATEWKPEVGKRKIERPKRKQ